jgi:hypothetical protein
MYVCICIYIEREREKQDPVSRKILDTNKKHLKERKVINMFPSTIKKEK